MLYAEKDPDERGNPRLSMHDCDCQRVDSTEEFTSFS
jgi:hypothetical protein